MFLQILSLILLTTTNNMKEYTVKNIESSPIENQKLWNEAISTNDFSFPWENVEAPETVFKALYDDKNFYFRFEVEDNNVLSDFSRGNKRDVVDSDRVEIFLRSDDKLMPYYCLEMDAEGRVLDYKAKHYRDFDFEWSWPVREDLNVSATKNPSGYIVQGAISIKSLKALGLFKNNQLEAGLYRGYCMALPKEKGLEADLRWISWIEPKAETPDFHIPSSFGILKFEK